MKLLVNGFFGLLLFLSGCTAIEVSRQVQSGRTALKFTNPKAALPYFQAAARLNPDYVTNFTELDVGIWTYIGRSYYELGDKERALEAFKRARQQHRWDYLARLYYGLLLAEDGNRAQGLKEIESGLRELGTWLETLPGRTSRGRFWDPGRRLARAISETRGLLAMESLDWPAVRENVLWLGKEFDEEIDQVKKDEELELRRDQEPDGSVAN